MAAPSQQLTELRSGGQPSSRLLDAPLATNGNNYQDRSPEFLGGFQGGPITVDVPGLAGAILTASTSDRNDGMPAPSAVRYFPRHLDGDGRELQAVCEPGDVFSLSSTLVPAAEGCYEGSTEGSSFYLTGFDGRVVALADLSAPSSSDPLVWPSFFLSPCAHLINCFVCCLEKRARLVHRPPPAAGG